MKNLFKTLAISSTFLAASTLAFDYDAKEGDMEFKRDIPVMCGIHIKGNKGKISFDGEGNGYSTQMVVRHNTLNGADVSFEYDLSGTADVTGVPLTEDDLQIKIRKVDNTWYNLDEGKGLGYNWKHNRGGDEDVWLRFHPDLAPEDLLAGEQKVVVTIKVDCE